MLKRTNSDSRSLNESGLVKDCVDELEERRGLGYEKRRGSETQPYSEDSFKQRFISQQGSVTRDRVSPKDALGCLEAPIPQSVKYSHETDSTFEHTNDRASGNRKTIRSLSSLDGVKELSKINIKSGFDELETPDRPRIRSVEPLAPLHPSSREIAPETFFYASAKHGGQHRFLTEFLDDDSVNEDYKREMRLLFGCLDRFADDPTYIERKRSERRVMAGGALLYDCPQRTRRKYSEDLQIDKRPT